MNRLPRPRRVPAGPPPRHRQRPLLEIMEDRQLLALLCRVSTNVDYAEPRNDGQLTLREAIQVLQGTYVGDGDGLVTTIPGNVHRIEFLTGTATIRPVAPLDPITVSTVIVGPIDALTGRPLVTLDGSTAAALGFAAADGLRIAGTDVTVRSLAFGHWGGAAIRVTAGMNAVVEQNFVGTTADVVAQPNGVGIALAGGIGATVRGNTISGNHGPGLLLIGDLSSRVFGNQIGLAPGSGAPLGNLGPGIFVTGTSRNSTIGGSSPAARNVIAANQVANLAILGDGTTAGASGHTILGNFLGTDPTGLIGLGNDGPSPTSFVPGLWLQDSPNNTIGDTTGGGNLISGNSGDGVLIRGRSSGNRLVGNAIGLAASGRSSLGNTLNGVTIEDASGNTIGPSNVIGSNLNGIAIRATTTGTASGNRVAGNRIGIDATETFRLGNREAGIRLDRATSNTIGSPGQGNVVVASGTDGIALYGRSDGNVIQGNRVGLVSTGEAIQNRRHGILVVASDDNVIGRGYQQGNYVGSAIDAGNILAFNASPAGDPDGAGIAVMSGSGNAILGNSIYNNRGLGIDLAPSGPNGPNPGDDSFPTAPNLRSIRSAGGVTIISGTLSGTPETRYLIEFFSNPPVPNDPAAARSGRIFLDSRVVITNSSGRATLEDMPDQGEMTLSLGVLDDAMVTATATKLQANGQGVGSAVETSEFSNAVVVNARADLAIALISQPEATVGLNASLTYRLSLTNLGPSTANNITLTSTLPAGVRLVSASMPGGPTLEDLASTTIRYPITRLAVGETAIVTIVVRTTTPTSPDVPAIVLRFGASANEPDPAITNNDVSSSATTVATLPGTFGLLDASLTVAEPTAIDGHGTATLTILRGEGSDGRVTLTYSLGFRSPADAAASPDQPVGQGSVTFEDGETSRTIVVPIVHSNSLAEIGLRLDLITATAGKLGSIASTAITVTNIDPPPPVVGAIEFDAASYFVDETTGFATIRVVRMGGADRAVSATVVITGGTATGGRDFLPIAATVAFADGDTTPNSVTVPILRNGLHFGVQTVLLALTVPNGGATIGAIGSTTLAILEADADPGPSTVQFAETTASVRESDGAAILTVVRSGDTSRAVAVSFATVDGSALRDRDYVATSGVITFEAGETTRTIVVPLRANGLVTPVLDFGVLLTHLAGAVAIGPSSYATVRVANTDPDLSGPVVTDLRTVPAGKGLAGFVLTFSRPIDASAATDLAAYRIVALGNNGTADRKARGVALNSAWLDPTGTVLTLVASRRLEAERFYQVRIVDGRLAGTDGKGLDGDSDRLAGGEFVASIGRGKSLRYADASGNLVLLGLERGGALELTRRADGEGRRLVVTGVRPRRTVLSAQVRRRATGNGRTTISAIDGAGPFGNLRIAATSPPVVVGRITPQGIRSAFLG